MPQLKEQGRTSRNMGQGQGGGKESSLRERGLGLGLGWGRGGKSGIGGSSQKKVRDEMSAPGQRSYQGVVVVLDQVISMSTTGATTEL